MRAPIPPDPRQGQLFVELSRTARRPIDRSKDSDGAWGSRVARPAGKGWRVSDYSHDKRTRWTRRLPIPVPQAHRRTVEAQMNGDVVNIRDGSAWPAITCIAFTPYASGGVLRGWCDLHLPRMKLRLHGCPCFVSNESAWIGLPSREIGKDADGKSRFAAMMEWDSRSIQNAFSDAAIAALDAYAPDWRSPR